MKNRKLGRKVKSVGDKSFAVSPDRGQSGAKKRRKTDRSEEAIFASRFPGLPSTMKTMMIEDFRCDSCQAPKMAFKSGEEFGDHCAECVSPTQAKQRLMSCMSGVRCLNLQVEHYREFSHDELRALLKSRPHSESGVDASSFPSLMSSSSSSSSSGYNDGCGVSSGESCRSSDFSRLSSSSSSSGASSSVEFEGNIGSTTGAGHFCPRSGDEGGDGGSCGLFEDVAESENAFFAVSCEQVKKPEEDLCTPRPGTPKKKNSTRVLFTSTCISFGGRGTQLKITDFFLPRAPLKKLSMANRNSESRFSGKQHRHGPPPPRDVVRKLNFYHPGDGDPGIAVSDSANERLDSGRDFKFFIE